MPRRVHNVTVENDPASAPSEAAADPTPVESSPNRQRILDRARVVFSTAGFEATTNQQLVETLGFTTGTLYYYFGSKADLYAAVDADVRVRVYTPLNEAVRAVDGFIAKFEAVLDTVQRLNEEDPSLAMFVGARRTDIRRYPEIGAAVVDQGFEEEFVTRMVDAGVDAGEILEEHAGLVVEYVRTLLAGLTDGTAHDRAVQERAIAAIKLTLRGELFRGG
jgi:AcrR family transcriptional regulator